MKMLSICVVLGILAMVGPISSAAQNSEQVFLNPVGTVPPKEIREWVRIIYAGELNSPVPVIWVSPRKFHATGLNVLIQLSRPNYASLIRSIRSRPCRSFPEEGSVRAVIQIEQFSQKKYDLVCTYFQSDACVVLDSVLKKPYLALAPGISSLRDLSKRAGCHIN